MDGRRFDALAKALAAGVSRRRFVGRITQLGGAVGLAGVGVFGTRARGRGATARQPPIFTIEHFKCYGVTPSDQFSPLEVELKDQFGSGKVRVNAPDVLCNPVGKNGQEIKDRSTHLTCYPIEELEPSKLPPSYVVENQFGSLTLKIGKTQRLCVPSLKHPVVDGEPKGDHLTCYTAKPTEGEVKALSFELKDQFGAEAVSIQDPRVVCTPTSKNEGAILDRELHYECRQIVDVSPTFQPRKVTVENQLGRFTFSVEKPDLLCAPSCKSLDQRCEAIPKANHYECYVGSTVEGTVQPSELTLKDQFDSGTFKVDVPRLLCTPVDKNGGGIVDDAIHYAVHPITPSAEFQPVKAFVNNQFGQNVFEIEAPELLFVPSRKTVLS
jgi:hypothetical protein